MHSWWLVGLWYQFLDISHIDWKRDKKWNKYGSIPDENGIPRKRTENPSPVSIFTEIGSHKYGNGQNKVENGTGRNMIFFGPFSILMLMQASNHTLIQSQCDLSK
jgi:hypothetical protein